MRSAAALLAALAIVTSIAPDAAACPAFDLEPALLGTQTEIGADGGVLIQQVQERRSGPHTIGFAVDGAGVEPTVQWLAPGLERWRVAGKVGSNVVISDQRPGAASKTVMWIAAPRGRRLRAPALRAATSTLPRPRTPMRSPGAPITTLTITLARPLPDDAVALIVYGPARGGDGVAWTAVEAGQTTFEIVGGGKGCGGGPGPSYIRDRVALAWVDGGGRISARSPLRTVGTTPEPRADD